MLNISLGLKFKLVFSTSFFATIIIIKFTYQSPKFLRRINPNWVVNFDSNTIF